MNKKILFGLLAFAVATFGAIHFYNSTTTNSPIIPSVIFADATTPESIIAETERGVVLIKTVVPSKVKDADPKVSIGAGSIIDENLILTNNHVIDEEGTRTVRAKGFAKEYEIEIIASDPSSDIALIKLKDWESFKKEVKYNILPLGQSRNKVAGDEVYVIGHPWSYEWTTSKGIVSSETRRMSNSPMHYLQVDAQMMSGNSGGPVIDNKGNIIGISTMVQMGFGSSLSFAVPVDLAKKVIFDLKEKRPVKWGTLGAKIKVDRTTGIISVDFVTPDGPFMKAGAKVGDVLVAFKTSQMNDFAPVTSIHDAMNAISYLTINENVVQFKIKRGNETVDLTVDLLYQDFSFFELMGR